MMEMPIWVVVGVLAGGLSVLLLFYVFIDSVWGRVVAGEVEVKASREGTIVMDEITLPDNWEPPPMLPGDDEPPVDDLGMY